MTLILGYIGPETFIPLASILAAVCGSLMMGWRFVLLSIKKLLRLPTTPKQNSDPTDSAPAPPSNP